MPAWRKTIRKSNRPLPFVVSQLTASLAIGPIGILETVSQSTVVSPSLEVDDARPEPLAIRNANRLRSLAGTAVSGGKKGGKVSFPPCSGPLETECRL